MKKKLIALATAAACMAGSINTVFASTFADINDVPWPEAAQYIDEAASLGLMAGYNENGKKLCKARNNVTYNEAVQLMYAIMCTYNSANKVSASVVSKWTSVMQTNNIPSWAYECVAYSLENGILSSNDLKIFMDDASTQNNARREDVAVIFGKALSKVYQVNPSATVNYNDKDQISASSMPYLELLNRLNLMVGDDNNNFNPKKNINRAEMAVLATKTQKELTGGSASKPSANEQIIGTAVEVKSDKITVKTGNTERTVDVSSSVSVIYNGASGKLSDINEGDNVIVVVNNSVATFITAYPANGSTSALTKGTISSISKSRITIQSGSRTASYKFNSSYNKTELVLDGSSSKDIDDLIDLVDDGATIEASISADKNGYITKITATTVDSSLKGEITYLSSSKITIKSGSKDYTYYLIDDTDDISVKIDGSSSSFDKLRDKYDDDEKFTATLTIDKDKEVTKIEAETSSGNLGGDMTYLSSTKITIKSGSKEYSYYLIDDTDDISVKIDGKTSDFDKLRDKYKDDEEFKVTLTLNSKKEVTKIEAESKSSSSSSSTSGSLSSLTSSTIKIKTSSGSTKSYSIDKNCSVTIDGSSSSVSRLKDRFDDGKKYTVKLTVSGDKVTKIAASLDETSDEYSGQIMSVDYDRIRIKNSDGDYKTYYLASSGCEFEIDGKFASINKVIEEYGDGGRSSVKAYISVNGADRATNVRIETGAITSDETEGTLTYLSSSRIKIKLSNGDTKSYDLAKSCSVTVDGKSSSVSRLSDYFNDDGESYEVKLTLNSSDDVTKIKAEGSKSSVKGELLSIDEDKVKVGEKLSGNSYVGNIYYFSGSVTVIVDGDEMDLEKFVNIAPGKTYTVELSRNSSGNVTKIVAKS